MYTDIVNCGEKIFSGQGFFGIAASRLPPRENRTEPSRHRGGGNRENYRTARTLHPRRETKMPEKKGNNRQENLLGPYDADACEVCGRCLVQCPVLGLGEWQAKAEMRALREGRPGRYVLARCETCMACNVACPNGANPMMLFLDRFHEHISRRGLPSWSLYFQPHSKTNFRTAAIARMPTDERLLLEKWADTSPCDEFAYPGCNLCTTPYLTRAGFLEGLNIRGGLEHCCGEMYFRTGMFDQLRLTARHLNGYLDTLGAKKMMVLCTAGYNLFTNVLPRFGLTADVEISPYLPWLLRRLENGDIEIKRKLNITATIQESCHSKVLGQQYLETPRKILDIIGVRVREMDHSSECAYCCGIGGGFPAKKGYHPLAVMAATHRVLSEARRTRADAIATYCAGCLLSMSSQAAFLPGQMPIYHIIELIQLAAGEKPARRNLRRGMAMTAGALYRQLPRVFDPRRFKPDVLDLE